MRLLTAWLLLNFDLSTFSGLEKIYGMLTLASETLTANITAFWPCRAVIEATQKRKSRCTT